MLSFAPWEKLSTQFFFLRSEKLTRLIPTVPPEPQSPSQTLCKLLQPKTEWSVFWRRRKKLSAQFLPWDKTEHSVCPGVEKLSAQFSLGYQKLTGQFCRLCPRSAGRGRLINVLGRGYVHWHGSGIGAAGGVGARLGIGRDKQHGQLACVLIDAYSWASRLAWAETRAYLWQCPWVWS